MNGDLLEGLKVILPRLGLVILGIIVLIFRKQWAKAISEDLKKKSRSKWGKFNYSEKYHLVIYTGGSLFLITLGIVTLLPLFDTTPNQINRGVVDFIRNYLVIPILGIEVLVTIVYSYWVSLEKE